MDFFVQYEFSFANTFSVHFNLYFFLFPSKSLLLPCKYTRMQLASECGTSLHRHFPYEDCRDVCDGLSRRPIELCSLYNY